jgi:Family of unknown function (DUF5832)
MSSQKQLQIDDDLQDVTFETNNHEDNKDVSLETKNQCDNKVSSKQYTKINDLENDTIITGDKYAIVSMISPRNILNSNTWGIKIRGFENKDEKAEEKAESIRKRDKYFDVFVGFNGHWHPMNPTTTQIESEKYKNKDLNKIMKNIHESEKKEQVEKQLKKEVEEKAEEDLVIGDNNNDDYSDDEDLTYNDKFIYENEDCLDEDKLIPNQRYAVISFASPELVNNLQENFFKIRGYTSNLQKAQFLAKQIDEKDKKFSLAVVEIGKWAHVNFTLMGNAKRKKMDLQTFAEKQKIEENNLNEIIGRYKKKLDDKKDIMRKRKYEQIKECADEMNEDENNNQDKEDDSDDDLLMDESSNLIKEELGKNKDETKERLKNLISQNPSLKEKLEFAKTTKNVGTEKERNEEKTKEEKKIKEGMYIQKLNRDKYATMERMRKRLEEKKKNAGENVNEKKVKINKEALRINEKRHNIEELKGDKDKIEANLKASRERMKELIAKRKANLELEK